MKSIISRGKTASSYITKNIEAAGFRAIHAPSVELNLRFFEAHKSEAWGQFKRDQTNKKNIRTYVSFVEKEYGNLDDLIFVHNEFLNLDQFLIPLLDSTDLPVLFSYRSPVIQALSMVRSKQKNTALTMRPTPDNVVEILRRETAHVPDYEPTTTELAFLQYLVLNLMHMEKAQDRRSRYIRYEDMVETPEVVEAEISWLLGTKFKFTSTSVVNKLTESDYISILAPQFTNTFIDWFDGRIPQGYKDLLSYFGYEIDLRDALNRR